MRKEPSVSFSSPDISLTGIFIILNCRADSEELTCKIIIIIYNLLENRQLLNSESLCIIHKTKELTFSEHLNIELETSIQLHGAEDNVSPIGRPYLI